MRAAIEIKKHALFKEDYVNIYFEFDQSTNIVQRFLTYLENIESTSGQGAIQYYLKRKSRRLYIECSFKFDIGFYSNLTDFMEELKKSGYEVEFIS